MRSSSSKHQSLIKYDFFNRPVKFTTNPRKAKKFLGVLKRSAEDPRKAQAILEIRNRIYLDTLGNKSADSQRSGKIIAVSGVRGGEGATTVSILLMMALGDLSQNKTLYVDGSFDIQNFITHKEIFDLKRIPTFSSNGFSHLQVYSNLTESYSFLSSQKSVLPVKFFSNYEIGVFFQELKKYFDFVILDMPPLLSSSETQLILQHADSFYLTCCSGKTLVADVERCKEIAAKIGGSIDGVILNRQRIPLWARLFNSAAFV